MIKNSIADLIDMRLHPFLIQNRERFNRIRETWSRKNYEQMLVEVEAVSAACAGFEAELKAALEADKEHKQKGLTDEDSHAF